VTPAPERSGLAALFPGQGSQCVGMARALKDEFPWTKEIFEEASDALSEDLLKLMLDGPEDTLQLTFNAQPAILTVSYAWFQVLRRTLDFAPRAAAGHSLGEYSALLAAGCLTLVEAVRLVRERGNRMQDAVPVGVGAMAAVLGLEDAKVEALCARASESDSSQVVPANYNAPLQVVVAGQAGAGHPAAELASGADPELKAKKFVPLKVSAPFHSPLMRPAAAKFRPALEAVRWQRKKFPVAHNVDGVLTADGDLVDLLHRQMDGAVRWVSCMRALETTAVRGYVELGPGKVLQGLGKRIVDVPIHPCDTATDVKALEAKWKEIHP
jgi:[acyl-carrier-protein] S-malonyltransferase